MKRLRKYHAETDTWEDFDWFSFGLGCLVLIGSAVFVVAVVMAVARWLGGAL